MAERFKERKPTENKLERETVVQCFTATDHLIMTPLARLYLKMGLRITKISKVIQYVPGRPLSPFVKHVTNMRIEAERAGHMTKANSAKGVGNSGYGKVSLFNLILTLNIFSDDGES